MHKKKLFGAAAVLLAVLPLFIGAQTAQAADPPVLFAKAYDLFSQGMYGDAASAFSELSAQTRGTPLACDADYFSLLSLVNAGRAAEAGALAESFAARYPDSAYLPEIEYQRCRVAFMLGDYEGALSGFERFSAKYPDGSSASSAAFWRAETLLALGRSAEALDGYLALLARFPGSPKRDAAEWRLESLGYAAREGRAARVDDFLRAGEERLRASAEAAEPLTEQRRERAYLLVRALRGAYGMQGGWSLPLYADMNIPGLPAAEGERLTLQAQASANALEALRVSRLKELLAAKAETLRLLAQKLEQFAAEVVK
ncbi:tetratricopeptide repeat protein [bacterium]|nr:tetratricopeptide repeat protein [bacterium]